METSAGQSPSPEEAQLLLQQLSDDESAVRYPPMPRWFFVAMASALAGVYLAQLLPPSDAAKATVALGIATSVGGSRYWFNRPGVAWVSMKFTDMSTYIAAMLSVAVVCVVIAATTGAWWIWIIGAVVASGIVLHTGHVYRKAYGDAH